MTLGTWFREYLYIPLGGNRKGAKRQVFNLLIVWFLTGLWHGAGWNFIIWGLYYFALIAIEKLLLGRFLPKLPAWTQHIYAMFFIVVGWVIFACDDMSILVPYLKSMFGMGAAASTMSHYYLNSYGALLVVGALGSLHFVHDLPAKIVKNDKILQVMGFVFSLAMLALSVAFIIGDSYNPFLYFRF